MSLWRYWVSCLRCVSGQPYAPSTQMNFEGEKIKLPLDSASVREQFQANCVLYQFRRGFHSESLHNVVLVSLRRAI